MPCRSDYLEASGIEKAASQVACLLGELDGKPFTRVMWEGYHPKAYNQIVNTRQLDKLTAKLCERLQSVDVSRYSLEMQLWWRNHQEADRNRREEEKRSATIAKAKEAALRRISPQDRETLGLPDPSPGPDHED